MRRLRRDSQPRSSNYVGLPRMAGRGAEEGRRKPPGSGIARAPGSAVPTPKIAARGAPRGNAPRSGSRKSSLPGVAHRRQACTVSQAQLRGMIDRAFRRSAPSHELGQYYRRTRRLRKTRAEMLGFLPSPRVRGEGGERSEPGEGGMVTHEHPTLLLANARSFPPHKGEGEGRSEGRQKYRENAAFWPLSGFDRTRRGPYLSATPIV
jgi:hypothetical protein